MIDPFGYFYSTRIFYNLLNAYQEEKECQTEEFWKE